MPTKPWSPKVGDVLFQCIADQDDDGRCAVSIAEWVVRTLRAKDGQQCAFLVAKNEFTWIKKPGKSQEYNWAVSIDGLWRKTHPIGGGLPFDLFATRRQALLGEIESQKKALKRRNTYPGTTPEDAAGELARHERLLSVLRGRITGITNRANTAKAERATVKAPAGY
jgi:hypothetical protein